MVKVLVVLWIVLCPGLFASAGQNQAPPAEDKVPPEAARQTNPVKPTPALIQRAKKLYGYDCAMCHGKSGDGKGDMAADFTPPLMDFTDPAALKNFTDGELFYIIKNGRGQMPPEGTRANLDETWSLVAYVRSLAKKAPQKTTAQ
jgi:mono/diheme cytochrome c family protein